jgi:hypothetical protein
MARAINKLGKMSPVPPVPPADAGFHAPLANGVDSSVPPIFGGPPPVQTQGVKTPALGIGKVAGVAKPRR